MALIIFFTLSGCLLLTLAIWIYAKISKTRRLNKLGHAFRTALNGGDVEEAVALGRAYYYLLNGYTGLDDEEQIRRDWQAIQQNRNTSTPKSSSKKLFLL